MLAFERLKASIGVEKEAYEEIFPSLKKHLRSWICSSLWQLLEKRASQKEYKKGGDCGSLRVLIIGGGPVGLRAAIECRMLGCKVLVVHGEENSYRSLGTMSYTCGHLATIEDLKRLPSIIDTILERDWKRTLLHGHSTKEATQVLRRAPVLIR